MPKIRLSARERKVLKGAENDARQMRANAVSHGSIQPRVKSKRILGFLDNAFKHGGFTLIQSINGKKCMITYSAEKHFKTKRLLVYSSARELLGNRKLGKRVGVPKLYANVKGVWVEVNIRW